jgi:RNA polymerase sigma factor (sigma-70 family)
LNYKRRHKISEEELVQLLKDRNQNAVGILYDNYASALYGVILRIVQNEEIAEDVLQDAFVKIWNSFPQYDSSKGKLFTWIVNLARNLAIDKVRSKDFINSTKNQSIDKIVSFVEMDNQQNYNPELIGLNEMVNKLDPEQKKIIDLLYFGGYTQAETAEKLEIPLGTVKTRARMAINKLREMFEVVNLN